MQYYKGKTIIIESLIYSCLIVAPFANFWESPMINDKKGDEHSCIGIKSFTYSSLFPIFEDKLPYKFKSIFI